MTQAISDRFILLANNTSTLRWSGRMVFCALCVIIEGLLSAEGIKIMSWPSVWNILTMTFSFSIEHIWPTIVLLWINSGNFWWFGGMLDSVLWLRVPRSKEGAICHIYGMNHQHIVLKRFPSPWYNWRPDSLNITFLRKFWYIFSSLLYLAPDQSRYI